MKHDVLYSHLTKAIIFPLLQYLISFFFLFFSIFFLFSFLPSGQKNKHTVNITLTYAVIVVDFVSFLAHSCQLIKQLSKSSAALVLI